MHYQYINGRPAWVQVASVSSNGQTLNGYSTYYLQYNWHGDVVKWVPPDGNGSNTITVTTDPWGVYDHGGLEYYIIEMHLAWAILVLYNGQVRAGLGAHALLPEISQSTTSGGQRNLTRGAPIPSIPTPRVTYRVSPFTWRRPTSSRLP